MRKIKLTQGQYALIDNEDFERVSKYKWQSLYSPCIKGYYAKTTLKNKKGIYMHRLILNVPIKKQIDHISHNTLDNRKSNIRICNHIQNQYNKKKRRKAVYSSFKGVGYHTQNKKWRARITINKKQKTLGLFPNEFLAAHAYDKAAKKYFGEFAYLNFEGESHPVRLP